MDLAKNLAWDTNAYYVGRLPAQFVASYTRLDSLLTWRPRERIEFSVVGQNLLSDHHTEFNDQFQSVKLRGDETQRVRQIYLAFLSKERLS